MTTTVVVNPASGGGRAGRMLPQVLARLRSARVGMIAVHRTDDWADAVSFTRRLRLDAADGDRLVVIGGDGMTHLGLNACEGTDMGLAVVPAGTGNDLARGFGLDPRRPLSAVDALLAGSWRQIDLIDTGGDDPDHQPGPHAQRYIGSIVASGFDALVNARANAMRRPRGSLRYAAATLAELPRFAPLPYRLEIDGQVREIEAMLVAVGNTTSYGGGMRICLDADCTDGQLDLTIVHATTRSLLVRMLPQMYTGGFVKQRVVERLRAKVVHLDGRHIARGGADLGPLTAMGDGEPIGPLPQLLTVSPAACRIAVPGASEN